MLEGYRVIHFVGIGGIGMSGIAEILRNLGYEVTGSDVRASESTERLKRLGVKIYIGHSAENIGEPHVVVISSAIKPDNPEVLEARKNHIPVIPRAEMLAELGRLKYGVLVAGAHGKTTTTSLLATVVAAGGLDPTVVIGGRLKAMGSNAVLGQGQFLVAEADESDGSFLRLTPTIGIVTNIDREHMDFFRDMTALRAAFVEFMNKVPFYGATLACVDNPHVRGLLPEVHRKVITYGFSSDADLRAENIKSGWMNVEFDAVEGGELVGRFSAPLPGAHNALNALAAVGAARLLKIPVSAIAEALKGFEGIERRVEFKGEWQGVKFFDDYGHHPTEIAATVGALKGSLQDGASLHVIFQPHRYSRTRDLMLEFTEVFTEADRLLLMDIYPAGEAPIDGVTSEALFGIVKNSDKTHVKVRGEITSALRPHLKSGDVVLTLGAGDVWKVSEEIIKELQG